MGDNYLYLCFEKDNLIFIAQVPLTEVVKMRTKRLLGAHKTTLTLDVDIIQRSNIALVQKNIFRMYNIPDASMRIHANVPIDITDWVITPTSRKLEVIIYFEDSING